MLNYIKDTLASMKDISFKLDSSILQVLQGNNVALYQILVFLNNVLKIVAWFLFLTDVLETINP